MDKLETILAGQNVTKAYPLPDGGTLLALNDEDRICEAAEQVMKLELSVRQTEALVKDLGREKEKKPRGGKKSIYARDLEERLGSRWDRKVRIVEGRRKSRLEIEYYGNEDLDRLLGVLGAGLPELGE